MPALITPLIVCGGNGTRLWPLSRTESPKQFQRMAGPGSPSFFQAAVRRHAGPAFGEPVIVTGAIHHGTVVAQLREIQATARVLCEPMGRNTGPAVLAACEVAIAADPDAVMVVVPADHVIEGDLAGPMVACHPAVAAGRIVTFGIPPRHAETGFGYIVGAEPLGGPVRAVSRFVEKPGAAAAAALIAGGALWASGLSMFRADVLRAEYGRLDPASVDAVSRAVSGGRSRDGALHLDGAAFMEAAAEPTEALVFERSDRIAVAPLDVAWDDVGSWKAMHEVARADGDGNVLQGDVIVLGSRDTLVRAESRLVSVVGLSDVVVVETADALLVASKSEGQRVKEVVEALKREARPETVRHAAAAPDMVGLPEGVPVPAAVAGMGAGEGFRLGTTAIPVGAETVMARGTARDLAIVVRGRIRATGPEWMKTVSEGGRVYADEEGEIALRNVGDEAAKLLFVTLGAEEVAPRAPAAATPVAKASAKAVDTSRVRRGRTLAAVAERSAPPAAVASAPVQAACG